MKLLIVSDSHGKWETINRVMNIETPDLLIHLGDYIGDAQKLSLVNREIQVEAVPGNCDGLFWRGDTERILSYEGFSFFLTHGHGFHVKSGTEFLEHAARNMGVDAVLFGHTHQALVEQTKSGMWLVNPGTAGGIHAPATYVIAYVEKGKLWFELKKVGMV